MPKPLTVVHGNASAPPASWVETWADGVTPVIVVVPAAVRRPCWSTVNVATSVADPYEPVATAVSASDIVRSAFKAPPPERPVPVPTLREVATFSESSSTSAACVSTDEMVPEGATLTAVAACPWTLVAKAVASLPSSKSALRFPTIVVDAMTKGAETVKIHGQHIPVRAHVENLHMLSAHADAGELMVWLSQRQREPEKVVLIHGEYEAQQALSARLSGEFGWKPMIPELGETLTI